MSCFKYCWLTFSSGRSRSHKRGWRCAGRWLIASGTFVSPGFGSFRLCFFRITTSTGIGWCIQLDGSLNWSLASLFGIVVEHGRRWIRSGNKAITEGFGSDDGIVFDRQKVAAAAQAAVQTFTIVVAIEKIDKATVVRAAGAPMMATAFIVMKEIVVFHGRISIVQSRKGLVPIL